jgi:hypothetical protein
MAADDIDGTALPDLVEIASTGLPGPVLRTMRDPGVPGGGACQTTPITRTAVTGCGVALNLGLAHVILPTPALGVTATDAAGSASLTLSLPASLPPGLVVYAQWGMLDPNGALPFAGQTYAATPGRSILIW